MNRMEEFALLQQELEQPVPELEGTVQRALRKRRRKRMIAGPLTSIAAAFAVFVALVNFSAPVAMALAKVPVLKELAEFVQFSHSFTQAVENEYAQIVDLEQSNDAVRAKIEYLIVDQKQVNVFYRLYSSKYTEMHARFKIISEDADPAGYFSTSQSSANEQDGALRVTTFVFQDTAVPDKMHIEMKVHGSNGDRFEPKERIATFEFLLEFDPNHTAQGRVVEVNQTIDLGGQKFTVADVEIYPSRTMIRLEEDPSNTVWLRGLDFYLQDRDGTVYKHAGGVSASSGDGTPSMLIHWVESDWFRGDKRLDLYITGARFVIKGAEKVRIDLETGTADGLPEGITLESVRDWDGKPAVTFRAAAVGDEKYHQLFELAAYDKDGFRHDLSTKSFGWDEDGTFTEMYHLDDYPYTEVWFKLDYTDGWQPEKPLKIRIK